MTSGTTGRTIAIAGTAIFAVASAHAQTPTDTQTKPAQAPVLQQQSSLPNAATKTANAINDEAVSTMQKQAVALVKQKRFKEARELYLQILQRQEFLSGKDSEKLIGPLNDVVKTSCMAGACYDAMPQLQRLLAIKRKVYGENYRDIPFNLQLMGEACEKKGKYAEALGYFDQAVAAQKRIAGKTGNLDLLLQVNRARVLVASKQPAAARAIYRDLQKQADLRKLAANDPVRTAVNAGASKVK